MTALLTDNLPLLASAPNGIRKLRELILELALSGKLVPQNPKDEPARELLKRIAEEKVQLVAEGAIKKQKPFPDIETLETPYALPTGWEWTTLPGAANYHVGETPRLRKPNIGTTQAYLGCAFPTWSITVRSQTLLVGFRKLPERTFSNIRLSLQGHC